jgi:hypothetical protein
MTQLTVRIAEDILEEAERYAHSQGTSLDRLVGDFLSHLARPDDGRKEAEARLRAAMDKGVIVVGDRSWRREDLYDR